MSSPQRRVSVSVNSVLSSLATSPETKNSWVGALRILSSVMTSQQQQQQNQLITSNQPSNFNLQTENPKLIVPIALSLQCWMRSGRNPSDFSLLLFTPASSSCPPSPCNHSPIDYILNSLESKKLEDAKTICHALLTKTNEPGPDTILNIFLQESEQSRISEVLSKFMLMETLELVEKAKKPEANSHELDLARFSVFLETLLAVNKIKYTKINDDCHAKILENISIAIQSEHLQKPLSQASLLQLVNSTDTASNKIFDEPYRNTRISESTTKRILSMLWDYTMQIIVNPPSSSSTTTTKISESIKQIMKFTFKNVPSIYDLESFAVKMDRDLQTKLSSSSSSSSSSIKKSVLADEEMLVFILDQYSRFAIDSNNNTKQHFNNNTSQPQILKLANSLFPHVARSSLIYAATLRALRSQGMWQEAIRFGENASEFVTGDDDDVTVSATTITAANNNKILAARQREQGVLSARMKMLIKNQNGSRNRYSANNQYDGDDVVESTVSDLTDHILATNNAKTEQRNKFSSGNNNKINNNNNNNNNNNIDNDISSSESIGEVIRAALNAKRWDAALMILKRIVHNNNNDNGNSYQHQRQQRIIQLDPSLVASVVRSIPQTTMNQYQHHKSSSTQTRNNVILDLAQCAEKVPFFAPMMSKMLQELGESDDKTPNGKKLNNNNNINHSSSTSSWESALIHLRAMAIANGTLAKVANQRQQEENAQTPSSVLPFTSPRQDAISNLIDRGMIRLAKVLLEHHCSFASDEIQITRIFLTSLLQKQPKRYVQNNNASSTSSALQAQTDEEITKEDDWNALVEVLLGKISSSKIKIEQSATSVLLHLIMLRTLEGKTTIIDLNNFGIVATDNTANEQMFNMQVRAVVASVRKVGKQIDIRQELPFIVSTRHDSCSLAIHLGLLQGLIEVAEKQGEENNSLLFKSAQFLLGNINAVVGDSSKILMTSVELMANVMRKILGLIKTRGQCEMQMHTLLLSRFFEITSQKMLTNGGEIEKEFATKFMTSPACSIQLILKVLQVVTSDQNEILDESLIGILSSRNSPSFFSYINNNIQPQQRHSLTGEDEELLKSVLMKVISNRVLGVASEGTKKISTTIPRRNNTWFEAASLVSQAWRLDGVPPQKMMTSMLMMQSGNQYHFPHMIVAQWEQEYRKVCAVTSPSLLMAFGQAQVENDKK